MKVAILHLSDLHIDRNNYQWLINKTDNIVSTTWWKSSARVTPEAQVPLTPESLFRMTPIKSWPVGSFLFGPTCWLYPPLSS